MATTAQTATTLLNGSFSADTQFEEIDEDTVSFSVASDDIGHFYGLARRFGFSPSGQRNNGQLEGELEVSDTLSLSTESLATVFRSIFSQDSEIDQGEDTVTVYLAEEDVGTYFRLDRSLNLGSSRHRENGSLVVTFQT